MRRRTGAAATALTVAFTLIWGALIWGALVWGNPVAASQEAALHTDIEARIGARWLPDGRVEIGLQVRSDDGAWGEPLLARKRLLPVSARSARWRSSSPITHEGIEIRVAARRFADDLVTVALRVRARSGDWSGRLLPGRRVLTTHGEPGVWTWSSPMSVTSLAAQVVAFYGHPGVRAMGVLGHGTPAEVAENISVWVEQYDRLNGPLGAIGAYHLITGVAQANPTSDGTWMYRLPHDRIAPYVEAAREHGLLLFLDNQIGWSDPLREVQLLEDFLKEPFVHMALDPEFATEPLGVRPGQAIGGITGSQVNEVLEYLSALVESEGLPPKILMVHQFAGRMLHDRDEIVPQPGVELSIDMDGIGTPRAKLRGYRLFAAAEPSQRPAFKLFFTQDTPLMTPQEVAAMEPMPDVIIYQ